jgi:hypothetical protein
MEPDPFILPSASRRLRVLFSHSIPISSCTFYLKRNPISSKLHYKRRPSTIKATLQLPPKRAAIVNIFSSIMESDLTYDTLDEPRKMIRILKILSTTPTIICDLKTVSLEDSPIFCALSYTWGDANITESIVANGKTIFVTINLANAMRDVHYQWVEGNCSEDPMHQQWLWADAVCINQKDTQEKNHQVPLMKEIYSSARRVFAWLGTKDDKVYKGFDTVISTHGEIRRIPSINEVLQTLNGEDNGLWSLDSKEVYALGDLEWFRSIRNSVGGFSQFHFSTIWIVFDLPYWRRLWVFQEVALAPELLLLCGVRAIPWSKVRFVMLWIQAVLRRFPEKDRGQYLPWENWIHLEHCGKSSIYRAIMTARSYVKESRSLSCETASKVSKFGLMVVARDAVLYRASNPKDYVYGFQGVSGGRLKIDYTAQKTVAQVYQDYATYWLDTWVADPERYRSSICDLWFLELAGIGFFWQKVPGLPSWAPNFVGIAECEFSDHRIHASAPRFKSAERGVFPNDCPIPRLVASTLYCVVVFVGQVSAVGPWIRSDPTVDSNSWLLWIFDHAVHLAKRYAADSFALKDLVWNIYRHTEGEDPSKEKGEIMLQFLLADLEYECKTRRNLDRSSFYDSLCLEAPSATEAQIQNVPEQRWRDAFSRLELNHISEDSYGFIEESWRLAGESIDRLCLGAVDECRIGIFPPLVYKDDVVCILKGFSIPAVLRKDGDHYIFVGGCSIRDVAHGQARELLQAGQARMEEIKIC